jgi:hypothetical protein
MPVLFEKNPVGQFEQLVPPAKPIDVPISHFVQPVAADVLEKEPGKHCVHDVELICELYLPASHGMHTLALEKVPLDIMYPGTHLHVVFCKIEFAGHSKQ